MLIVLKGVIVFVEMKTDKDKQSKAQKEFEKKVKELEHNYIVLHNFTKCIEFVKAVKIVSDLEKLKLAIKKLNN